ncbi:MAG: hypothetical protein IT204_17780 [Fimbriimonadaceae bacterium]|nr:hypothetical protein [Fimbriimonadaceae bacterium]
MRRCAALLALLAGQPGALAAVQVGDVTVALPAGPGTFGVPLTVSGPGLKGAALRFFDGRVELGTAGEAALPGIWRAVGGKIVWTGERLDAQISLRGSPALPLIEVKVAALREPVWVRVALQLPFTMASGWTVFDGRGTQPGAAGLKEQRELRGTFPAVAAYDARRGVAVGLDPGCWVSRYRLQVASNDGLKGLLTCAVPLAIDAGKPETLTFALASFDPGAFGYLPAIEQWHDSFVAFRPAAGIDPRVLRACANGAADRPPHPAVRADWDGAALCRATGAGWDWKIGCYRRGGDLVGRPDRWGDSLGPGAPDWLQTPEALAAWRRAQFQHTAAIDVAPLLGLVNWVDEAYRERFADSLITAADVPDGRGASATGWPLRWTANRRAYPANNSFGDQLLRDLTDLLPTLAPAGVAHDLATGGAKYRPRRWQAGRSYDERGVWTDEGLGIAQFLRQVHSLKRAGSSTRLATAGSFYGDALYPIVAETDVAVHDANPHTALQDPAGALRDRLLLGRKTRCWLHRRSADDLGTRPDLPADPAGARALLQWRWDTALLWCLRFGWLPSPDLVNGYAPAHRLAPLIADCVRAGWRPVPAVTAPQPLWLARYGRGFDTRLVVANPHLTQAVSAQLTVHNRFIGEGVWLFARGDGEPTTNHLRSPNVGLTIDLPPRGWMIYYAAGRHGGGEGALEVRLDRRWSNAAIPQPGRVETSDPTLPAWFFDPGCEATGALWELAGARQAPLAPPGE